MSARTSPSITVKSTRLTAKLSPKDFVSACVERRAMSARSLDAGGKALDRAHDARGQRQDQHDQHHAEQQLPVRGEADSIGLQEVERDGTHDRSDKGAEASKHGHEDDLAG